MVRRRKRKRQYYYTASQRRSRALGFEPVGLNLSPDTKRGIAIISFLVFAIISALGIFGLASDFGDLVSRLIFLLFGRVGYVSPVVFLLVSLSLVLGGRAVKADTKPGIESEKHYSMLRTYLGIGLLVISITGIFHLQAIRAETATAFEIVKGGQGGGYLGIFTSFPLHSLMGYGASLIILIALALISFLIAFNLSLHKVFSWFISLFKFPVSTEAKVEEKPKESVRPSEEIKINTMENSGFATRSIDSKNKPESEDGDDSIANDNEESAIAVAGMAVGAIDSKIPQLDITPAKYKKGQWKLPPLDLLEETDTKVDSGNIEARVKIIQKTLEDFGLTVEMGEVNVGPTVTQFTFRPAVGVKLSQIVALRSDLALALAAPSLRIEAPIPGKALVGIEVPNKTAALVRLKDLLGSDALMEHASTLVLALGRDVAGQPMIADLAKMPHLLIAGATNTGKSVAINTILTSFLYHNSPEELRMIMIDPKRVELTLYNGIPHLLTPVITDHKQAVNALKWMVAEMERRYKVLQEEGKRNIDEYNKNGNERLPYIVLFVDELADLMSVAQRDVEASIVRLAQMARAVGLHLILATQRPSVNIITGLIKANITSRIAFAVASQVDSRTILDMGGAEALLGNGDMLYTAANLPKPKRIQGPFISETEVRKVVRFLKDQSGPVDYQEEILEPVKSQSGYYAGDDDDADDEIVQQAIEEIKRAGKASASLLQRRLKVGYARAARILDILEEKGLIGPSEGAKPREIYMEE